MVYFSFLYIQVFSYIESGIVMISKDISIFSSGSHLVQQSGTVCAIVVEGIMSNISVKLL